MYKIAVCDDETTVLNYICGKIEVILQRRKADFEISRYSSGDKLLEDLYKDDEKYHAVFLDIEMDGRSGLEVADRITRNSKKIHIAFITNRDDLVFEAIDYRPFGFVRKSRLNEELEKVLERLLAAYKRENEFIEIEVNKTIVRLNISDILFLESQGHYIQITCTENTYRIRGRIFDYEIKLAKYNFIRIHVAYIVNMHYISFVKHDKVSLTDGLALPISRKKYEDIKNKHLEYVRECAHGAY